MSGFDELTFKKLNKEIMGSRFVDLPLEEYLYASLSQPPIKIIERVDDNDIMSFIVECPNCKNHINYGNDIFMYKGYIYCSSKGCYKKLMEKLHK